MKKNRVKFNLKNVHYAPLSFSSGNPIYSTPVPINGTVSISLDANGEAETFYEDGLYFTVSNNMGYTGSLEIALLPDHFRKYALGELSDANKVLTEKSDVVLNPFALIFEFDGDKRKIRHVLYYCTASRTSITGSTRESSSSVQTETLSISVVPLPDGTVKSKTSDDTTTEAYMNWFSRVYLPADTSNRAKLSMITITGATLVPSFSENEYAYAVETGSDQNTVSAAGANDASVTIFINGSLHANGARASWLPGVNMIEIMAAKNGLSSTVYSVCVTKTEA